MPTIGPNPGREEILISHTDTEAQNLKIEILSAKGNLLYTGQIRAGFTEKISTEAWASGMYFIRFVSEGGNSSQSKWIKQ